MIEGNPDPKHISTSHAERQNLARRGALWDVHRRHFGKDGDPIFVWQAPTRVMNPTVPQGVIDEAAARDPASAAAEYNAELRRDVESFVALICA